MLPVERQTSANRACRYEGDYLYNGALYYQRSHVYQAYNYLLGWITWQTRVEVWKAVNGQWVWDSCRFYEPSGITRSCY